MHLLESALRELLHRHAEFPQKAPHSVPVVAAAEGGAGDQLHGTVTLYPLPDGWAILYEKGF